MDGQRAVENALGSAQANGSVEAGCEQIKSAVGNTAIVVNAALVLLRINKLAHFSRIRSVAVEGEGGGVGHITHQPPVPKSLANKPVRPACGPGFDHFPKDV